MSAVGAARARAGRGSWQVQCLAIGITAIATAVSAIAAIAAGAAWQVRFPVAAAAALLGPAVPLLRLRRELTLAECLVYGAGADVAVQMLTGLGLVMVRAWVPVAAFAALMLASLAAGLQLIRVAGWLP